MASPIRYVNIAALEIPDNYIELRDFVIENESSGSFILMIRNISYEHNLFSEHISKEFDSVIFVEGCGLFGHLTKIYFTKSFLYIPSNFLKV